MSEDAPDRYHSYVRGWVHAAGCRVRDPAFFNNANETIRAHYEDGFSAGQKARRVMLEQVQDMTGYKPTILRDTDAHVE